MRVRPTPWPAEFAHHREALRLGVLLDGRADIAQSLARLGLRDAQIKGMAGRFDQPSRLLIYLPTA